MFIIGNRNSSNITYMSIYAFFISPKINSNDYDDGLLEREITFSGA